MKRNELLKRLPYEVPEASRLPVIIDTDARNEADDQYAIMHHLLTPKFDVRGIVAAHYEGKETVPGTSMEKSYQEILRVLKLADISDVPAYRGCTWPLEKNEGTPEGVEFLIEEARKAENKLYVAAQGAMTNIAAAIKKAPDIAKKLVVLWNGGGPYPEGRPEFNVMQDPEAVRVLLHSDAEIWQTHQDVYATLEVSLAELAAKVKPCGSIGEYLFEQLLAENEAEFNPHFLLRSGENWTLGDNAPVAVLLMNQFRGQWHMEPAREIGEDLKYAEVIEGRMIRVYEAIDVRFTLEDFFAKMSLVYGK